MPLSTHRAARRLSRGPRRRVNNAMALVFSLSASALVFSVQHEAQHAPSRAFSATSLDRRALLSLGGVAAVSSLAPAAYAADSKGTVVVFGGSGYVGAYASQMLAAQGYSVVSVSRKTPAEQAEKVKSILGVGLPQVDYKSLDAGKADLSGVLTGASAVISCVGIAPGGKDQRDGNGKVNTKIADAVKAAGIERFVYIGVASEMANSPAKFLLGDYFQGKAEAEAAVAKDFGSAALVLKPGIIAGGPPGELRPPGPPGMTPVPVEAVAKAAVAGALGRASGKADGYEAIVAAAAK